MIIRSIKAENFMKFSRLNLLDLPEAGVIGIIGPNESGKSTIGEALLFAFFGRTKMSKDCPLESLIHWGSEYMRVEIDFVLLDQEHGRRNLRIYREIDRFGTNYAKILELPGKQEVARGNLEVISFIQAQVGFDFFGFQHAFYHDQYGSRLVDDSQREFLERMTGVRQMDSAIEKIKTEVEQLEREFGHYQKDIGRNLKQIEHFARTAERLPELREEEEKAVYDYVNMKETVEENSRSREAYGSLIGSGNGREQRFVELASARGSQLEDGVAGLLDDYRSLQSRCIDGELDDTELAEETGKISGALEQANKFLDAYRQLRGSFVEARETLESELYGGDENSLKTRLTAQEQERMSLAAVLKGRLRGLLAGGALFLLFAGLAVAFAVKIESLENLLGEIPSHYVSLGCGGVGLLALLFLSLKYVSYRGFQSRRSGLAKIISVLKKKIQDTKSRIRDYLRLEELKDSGAPRDYVEAAGEIATGAAAKRLEEFRGRYSALLGLDPEAGPGDYTDLFRQQAENEKTCRKRIKSLTQGCARKLKDSEAALKKAQSSRDRISNELREAEGQLAKKETLEEKVAEFESAALKIRREIDDRRTACELLQLCSATTREKVGPTLSRYLKCILPRLTEGRYRDVKLDPDLKIQVFADERSDFISAVELSGGTNEALMLGLRLALSQAHITAHTRQKQFMFLDEPFKMMDGARVVGALESLGKLSEELCQFFVVQPRCEEEQVAALDRVIRTAVETTELKVDFAASSADESA